MGVWEVGFMPQWITREFLASRGGARFTEKQMKPSHCPLLGYTPGKIVIEGGTLSVWFFEVDQQPEVALPPTTAARKSSKNSSIRNCRSFSSVACCPPAVKS